MGMFVADFPEYDRQGFLMGMFGFNFPD